MAKDITVDELADHSEITLIDVREPDEFAAGHVPWAVNIPLGQLKDRVDEVPAGPVEVICQLGGRSLRGAKVLEDAGRADVSNVVGGTTAWVETGRLVET